MNIRNIIAENALAVFLKMITVCDAKWAALCHRLVWENDIMTCCEQVRYLFIRNSCHASREDSLGNEIQTDLPTVP